MRDILIEFLQTQLNQHRQLLQNIAVFLAGLTGVSPEHYTLATGLSNERSEPSAPTVFYKRDRFTSSDGMLRLSYSRTDPSAKRAYLALLGQANLNNNGSQTTPYQSKGGDKNSQVMSESQNVQQQKQEDSMKYLTKRNDGRWQGSKVIDGKRIYVYARTQAECYEKLKKLGKQRNRSPKVSNVADFAIYFLETYKKGNISDRTYEGYVSTAKKYISFKTPLNKVTTQQLQTVLNNLPATRTRVEVFQLLRQIFKKAYELDLIKKDVSQFLIRGRISKSERRALTVDEQRILINSLTDDVFSQRVLFYLCTGARPSELATVRKEELRPGWVKINGTKTAGAVRWVKISQKMYEILRDGSEKLYHFDDKRFRQKLQSHCQSIGIECKIDIYTLRHTFATNLYILRVPEKDRQMYMGHAHGSAMTNDVYTTFSPDTTPQNIYDIYGDLYPKF